VLDVKTGSGAFMPTLARARELAESLVSVANGAGLRTRALLTDMNEPLASAAGNALEVRNAVAFLTGAHHDPRLLEVTLELAATVLEMTGIATDHHNARHKARAALVDGRALERFSRMVKALGGPADFVERMDQHLPPAPIIRDVFAEGQGRVTAIDTRGVGMAVVALGGGRRTPADRIDHRVGFDRLAGLGEAVDRSRPIARMHAADEIAATDAEQRLRRAYALGEVVPKHALIVEQVGPGAP
jgi:thymidine phosphorylase